MPNLIQARQTLMQWIRFSLVGVKANAVYFCLYVLLTAVGLRPSLAVTIVFIVGAFYTFWFNKSFVFRDSDRAARQFPRYLFVYLVAWGLNIAALDYMIRQGINHIIAQGVLICVFAVLIFVAQKTLVFRGAR